MSPQEGSSVPPAPSGFRFSSGRLCLDLAATLTDRGGQAVELLARPSDLGAWLHQAGLLDRPPSVDTAQLQEARRLREAVAGSALATARGERLPPTDVDRINRGARYPVVPLLDPETGTVVFDAPRKVEGAFGRIARDAVDLLGGEERSRVKVCARPGCGALFVDRTRTGSRRWCSMATCGNRVKVATYRGKAAAGPGSR